jgi:hypothetical protein
MGYATGVKQIARGPSGSARNPTEVAVAHAPPASVAAPERYGTG